MTYLGVDGVGPLPGSGPALAPVLVSGLAPPGGDLLRRQTAALLQHCYRWLEQTIGQLPKLADVVPALVTAVQQYEAQQYEACLAQTLAVVRVLEQVRATTPNLPAL